MRFHTNKRQSGFTLMELLIVLAIAGVMLGVGVPGLQTMSYNSKRLSMFQQLYASLQSARLEAVSKATNVTVCKRNTAGTACDNSANWHDGWIIFLDADEDGVVDGGEDIIRVFDDVGSDIWMEGNIKVSNRVTFDLLGRTGNNGTISICDVRGPNYARGVVISQAGRVRAWSLASEGAFDADDCS